MLLPPTRRAEFVQRDNRFRVTVRLDGDEVAAHLSDPGRLTEILVPGCALWLVPAGGPGRVTEYDVLLAEHDGILVNIMPRLANTIAAEALAAGWLTGARYSEMRHEVRLGSSRIDLLLCGQGGRCWVEVKSCSLVERRLALFPDAPTARGRRHLAELAKAAEAGDAAKVVFVIARPDADRFAPHRDTDPAFADALADACARGVGAHAFRCDVSREEIRVAGEVPVLLA